MNVVVVENNFISNEYLNLLNGLRSYQQISTPTRVCNKLSYRGTKTLTCKSCIDYTIASNSIPQKEINVNAFVLFVINTKDCLTKKTHNTTSQRPNHRNFLNNVTVKINILSRVYKFCSEPKSLWNEIKCATNDGEVRKNITFTISNTKIDEDKVAEFNKCF